MLKRYDWSIKPYPNMREEGDGRFYLVSDVEREMIPRPDPEEARKAVDTLLAEVMWMYEYKHNGHDDLVESQQDKVLDARAAVLALMGVEVK